MTVREILDSVAECVDFNTSHYIFTSIVLPLIDKTPLNFSTKHNEDKRAEMYIVLGKDASTFKHGHIKTVYCTLPREAITPDMEKYRDMADPNMYKFRLPEREFNSILNRFPVDMDATIEMARNHYAYCGYEWDGNETWKKKLYNWFGWEFLLK